MIAFYLKKVIGMLLMPIPLTVIGIFLGLWLARKHAVVGKSLIACSGLFLLFSSWHPVADALLEPFEDDYPTFNLRQPVDAVVVLGGCQTYHPNMPEAAQLCGSAIHRLLEGLRILQANPEALLLVSGYAGTNNPRPNAHVTRDIAINMGVTPERILAFPEAKDTQEEAQLMQPHLQGKRFALVSEASHLPRATQFFQQQGLDPLPAPAMRMAAATSSWRIDASANRKTERAFYEQLGHWWQALRNGF